MINVINRGFKNYLLVIIWFKRKYIKRDGNNEPRNNNIHNHNHKVYVRYAILKEKVLNVITDGEKLRGAGGL